ncbi:hypothetical protein GCM10008941_04350 [Rhizomicrobium palustre]
MRDQQHRRRKAPQKKIGRGADPLNVAAHEVCDAGMAQPRDIFPGRTGKSVNDPGSLIFDKADLQFGEADIACEQNSRAQDHHGTKQANQNS